MYVAGLEKMIDGYSVMLMESTPSPPIKGDNEWMIHVRDPMGANLDGVTVAVTPFMPDHGHKSPKDAMIAAEGDGMYMASPVSFFMAGLWQTTVDVTPVGESKKSVTFNFCVTD
jgi:hypothetical protein